MIDPASGNALVFNGELFGAEDLRVVLQGRGHTFHGQSDTEILLVAIREWGLPRALDEIRGQFAFAYIDERNATLFLARDRLGIRPLYYADRSGRIAFASEQKALLEISDVDRTPNRRQLLRYLALGRTDDVAFETMLTGVRSLPAGHYASWNEGRLRVQRYHRFDTVANKATIADVARELERAVEEQLVSDVPVGAMVSGGVDSSAVALLADRARSLRGEVEPLHLFLYHDRRAEADEREYQEAVLKSFRAPHETHWVSSSPDEFAASFDQYVDHQEEPYGDISSYAEYCIARVASEAGVKVLLSGLGGDEVFVGYPSYMGSLALDLVAEGEFGTLRDLLASVGGIFGGKKHAEAHLAMAALYYLVPAAPRNALTALRAAKSSQLRGRALLDSAIDGFVNYHRYDGIGRTNAALRSSIESWCIPRYLLHSDRVCLAWGVEGRVPLLDERLIRTAFGVEVSERVGESGLKRSLREAARSVLPREILERRWKLGFHAPVAPYVSAVSERLYAGAEITARALEVPRLNWDSLPASVQWRWGALGAYLEWSTRGRAAAQRPRTMSSARA